MASEEGVAVDLYIYDLSLGLAAILSPNIIGESHISDELIMNGKDSDGRQVEGVWHTAVVVYEREFFYGAGGITSCAPGGTQLGQPHKVERKGTTFVPFSVFLDYVQGLATTNYSSAAYRLLEHNCNHFSDEVLQFLCGARVPKHILQQPDALPAPYKAALTMLLDKVAPSAAQPVYAADVRHARQDSPEYNTLNEQVDQARVAAAELGARRSTLAEKVARKERRREKKRRKALQQRGLDADDMAEAVEVAPGPAEQLAGPGPSSAQPPDVDQRTIDEERRRARDPPIVYKDIDGAAEFDKLVSALGETALGPEDRQSLDELQQYLVQGEGSWVLGDDFLAFVGRLLGDGSVGSEVRAAALRCLAAAALREDVSLVLHQDRRHHALLSYAQRVDRLPLEEQQALALFMCNLFENISSSEWLLYISEWEADGQQLSNIRATTKVCVHATLSEDPTLRDLGTALMHNIATKEVKTVVFDEVCVELSMALLQLLQLPPEEEQLWRALRALARLAQHSADVPQLVAMVGPDPSAFRGTSPRVDEQIDLIAKKLK